MNLPIQNRWLRRAVFAVFFVAVGVVLSFGVLVVWLGTYPDNVDPKNIYYVLWKHGLNNNMNLDYALGAMIGDVSPERQVQGLTKDQLKARFDYVRTLEEVTPYYRACYSTPVNHAERGGQGEGVVFLRDTPWMVAMKNGTAVDVILCKGY